MTVSIYFSKKEKNNINKGLKCLKKINFLILIVGLLILQIGVFAQDNIFLPTTPESLSVPSIVPLDPAGLTTNVVQTSLKDQNNKSVPVLAITQQISFLDKRDQNQILGINIGDDIGSTPVTFYVTVSSPHMLMKETYNAGSDGTISSEEKATGITTLYFVTNSNKDTNLALVSYKANDANGPNFKWQNRGDSNKYYFTTVLNGKLLDTNSSNTNLYVDVRNLDNSFTRKEIKASGDSYIRSWSQLATNQLPGTFYQSIEYTKGNSIPNISDTDYKNLSSFITGSQGSVIKQAIPQDIIKKDEITNEAIPK